MQKKTETGRLLTIAILSGILATLVKMPFVVLYHLVNIEAILWAGELYGVATLMLGTIAIVGVMGGISEERALAICRVMFQTLYFRLT